MAKKGDSLEGFRDKLREAAIESGLTQEEIGIRMGFSKSGARQAVSRLLNSEAAHDPRLSTVILFAKAINKTLKDLI